MRRGLIPIVLLCGLAVCGLALSMLGGRLWFMEQTQRLATTPQRPTPTSLTTRNPYGPTIGNTLSLSNVQVTLRAVTPLAGDASRQPHPGTIFIVTHLRLHNAGTVTYTYSQLQFHVKTGKGVITGSETPSRTYTGNDLLTHGSLAAGQTVEADLVFQVPHGDHLAALLWQPPFYKGHPGTGFNLGL